MTSFRSIFNDDLAAMRDHARAARAQRWASDAEIVRAMRDHASAQAYAAKRTLRRFAQDDSGEASVTFALSLAPLWGPLAVIVMCGATSLMRHALRGARGRQRVRTRLARIARNNW